MKKKEEDVKRAREAVSEAERKAELDAEARRRLQTLVKQRDAKIAVLENKMEQMAQETDKVKKELAQAKKKPPGAIGKS